MGLCELCYEYCEEVVAAVRICCKCRMERNIPIVCCRCEPKVVRRAEEISAQIELTKFIVSSNM